MTAHTSHQPSGRYRFRQLARMEWIKLRSLRSTWLTLAIAVAASAGIALATGSSTTTLRPYKHRTGGLLPRHVDKARIMTLERYRHGSGRTIPVLGHD
jgi:hypothetical protein